MASPIPWLLLSDGSFVIMRGSTPAIDMTDLDAGTWYAAVFEFNGFAGIERYNRH